MWRKQYTNFLSHLPLTWGKLNVFRVFPLVAFDPNIFPVVTFQITVHLADKSLEASPSLC